MSKTFVPQYKNPQKLPAKPPLDRKILLANGLLLVTILGLIGYLGFIGYENYSLYSAFKKSEENLNAVANPEDCDSIKPGEYYEPELGFGLRYQVCTKNNEEIYIFSK